MSSVSVVWPHVRPHVLLPSWELPHQDARPQQSAHLQTWRTALGFSLKITYLVEVWSRSADNGLFILLATLMILGRWSCLQCFWYCSWRECITGVPGVVQGVATFMLWWLLLETGTHSAARVPDDHASDNSFSVWSQCFSMATIITKTLEGKQKEKKKKIPRTLWNMNASTTQTLWDHFCVENVE